MKKIVFIALVALSITTSYAKDKVPKIEVKDDTVMVDKKAVFILAQFKNGSAVNYFVKDLSGTKLLFLQENDYVNTNRPNPNYSKFPNGPRYLSTYYFEVTFLESKEKAEIEYFKQSKLAEFIVKSGLIVDGKITKDKEEEFILINGNKFSEEKSRL